MALMWLLTLITVMVALEVEADGVSEHHVIADY